MIGKIKMYFLFFEGFSKMYNDSLFLFMRYRFLFKTYYRKNYFLCILYCYIIFVLRRKVRLIQKVKYGHFIQNVWTTLIQELITPT